jgi:hypothetical protein
MDEAESRRIAGLLGPTTIVMIVSEFPPVQPRLYNAQIPPVVYLSGVLMFVAGLAIVRAHNRWRADWTVLVTLSGWLALALGTGANVRGERLSAEVSQGRKHDFHGDRGHFAALRIGDDL